MSQYSSTYDILKTPEKTFGKIHLGFLNFEDESNFLNESKTEPDIENRDYISKPSPPSPSATTSTYYESPTKNQWRYFISNNSLTLDDRKNLFQKVTGKNGNGIKLLSYDSNYDNLPNTTPLLDFNDCIDWSWYPYYLNTEFDIQTPSQDSIVFQFGLFAYDSNSSLDDFYTNSNPIYGTLSSVTIYIKNKKYYCAISRVNHSYSNPDLDITQSVISTISDTEETIGKWNHIMLLANSSIGYRRLIVAFNGKLILEYRLPDGWSDYSSPNLNQNLSFSLSTHENIQYKKIFISSDGSETESNYYLDSALYYPIMLWGSGHYKNTFRYAKNVSKTKTNVTATINVSSPSSNTYLTNRIEFIKDPLPEGELTLSFDFSPNDYLVYDNIEIYKLSNISTFNKFFDISINVAPPTDPYNLDLLNPISLSIPDKFNKDILPISLDVENDYFKSLKQVEDYINKTYLGSQQAADDFQLLMKVTDTSYWPVEFCIDNNYHIHIKPDPIYLGVELYVCTNKQFLYQQYKLT